MEIFSTQDFHTSEVVEVNSDHKNDQHPFDPAMHIPILTGPSVACSV